MIIFCQLHPSTFPIQWLNSVWHAYLYLSTHN